MVVLTLFNQKNEAGLSHMPVSVYMPIYLKLKVTTHFDAGLSSSGKELPNASVTTDLYCNIHDLLCVAQLTLLVLSVYNIQKC